MTVIKLITLITILFCNLAIQAGDRPNVLWIVSEDNGVKWIGSYGGVNAKTPAIDGLAKEGFRYTNCFDNAAVCAPTRSTWLTGMLASSTGTQPMRSTNRVPVMVKYYNEQLQKAGYFTSNSSKTDYNLSGMKGRDPMQFWDYQGRDWAKQIHDRKDGKPFFIVVNVGHSHESHAFPQKNPPRNDPAKMKLHSYHPDIPEMRETYATYADAVEKMDEDVGKVLAELKSAGLHEDTIVVYNSDHGGVLPRSKRFLYSSGIHCPLIVRIPEKYKDFWPAKKPGMTVDRMVSFVDMPKTWISLAGGEIPENYQGTIFLGKDIESEPKYHFGFRGRADECYDSSRVMRGKRYSYHKNYAPFVPNGQFLPYMHNMIATPAWNKLHKEGKTNAVTGRFFRPRPSEEFYDNEVDFDNVNNLIDAPEHQEKIAELRAAMRAEMVKTYDTGLMPESMRNRRRILNKTTFYEMVRDPNLYPLEKYLDTADIALARKIENMPTLVEYLKDEDECMRYWGVIGCLLLEEKAAAAKDELVKLMDDESIEIPIFAAWALYKMGEKKVGLDKLSSILHETNSDTVGGILDRMGEDSTPIIKAYAQKRMFANSYLSKVVQRKGLPALSRDMPVVIPTESFFTNENGEKVNGLTGEYFATGNFTGDVKLTRLDKNIDFKWKEASPTEEIPVDQFSVRWTGKLLSKDAGGYIFSAFNCDDGARFWVDGEQILQHKFGRIVLEANKEYEIKFEFMENRGLATAILEWIEPAKVPVKLK